MKAKEHSVIAKWIGAGVIVAGLIAKGLGVFPGVDIGGIILAGGAIPLLFGDVSASILVDKFTAKKGAE